MLNSEITTEQSALVLEIERVFAAPRELIWRMWRDSEHLVRWHGPEGCALSQCEQDFRTGGKWRRTMTAGPGHSHVIFGEFIEVDEPYRLSFTYINERDGFETIVKMEFLDQDDGTTRMRFRQTPFLDQGERDGHHGGWSSSFDLLTRYLTLLSGNDWGPKGRPRIEGVAADIAAAKARYIEEKEGPDEHHDTDSRGIRS